MASLPATNMRSRTRVSLHNMPPSRTLHPTFGLALPSSAQLCPALPSSTQLYPELYPALGGFALACCVVCLCVCVFVSQVGSDEEAEIKKLYTKLGLEDTGLSHSRLEGFDRFGLHLAMRRLASPLPSRLDPRYLYVPSLHHSL